MAMLIVAAIGAMPVAGWSQIEEIVVTTRKKEESLQDVPIAVDAIGSVQIERQGIADLNDIVKASPSVQFDRAFGPSDTRITVRGLSNTRGRSNVAFLVDNIDVTTENLISAGSGLLANRRLLTDVERIEIVKGPQSALYGRAAFAGAFNYITKEPGDFLEGTAKLDFAEDGFQQVDAAVGGPISDTFGLRATGFWYNQDGRYVNSISGEDVGGSAGSGAALTGVWRPNDITKIKLRGEYSKEDYDPLANIRVGGGWNEGQGMVLAEYPDGMLQHARNMILGVRPLGGAEQNGIGFNRTNGDTKGILDYNQYCPDSLKDPSKGPGLCVPTTFGDASGRVVKHSENPLTGADFDGSDLETFRFSTIANFDMDGGTLTSWTGWTNFTGQDQFDQDWQAETEYRYTPPGGTPVTLDQMPLTNLAYASGRTPDQLLGAQVASTSSTVDQFSQELRFGSKLDGPVQYTLGALFWDETRGLYDRNSIISCLPVDKQGQLTIDANGQFVYPTFRYQSGLCDGSEGRVTGPNGQITGPTVVGWQQQYLQKQNDPNGQIPAYWRADTRHWSFYGTLNWEFAESWSVDLETRFVAEDFRLEKPNQSTCTSLADAFISTSWLQEGATSQPYDAVCAYNEILSDTAIPGQVFVAGPNGDTLRPLTGSTTSHFTTPKVTLNWKPTTDTLLYFFWAKAQKPGGINQLTAGGAPSTVAFEKFDPEKLDAWEFGTKNTFDVGGPLQANASFFLQDYTDKQVSTQVVDSAGVSQPKVLNASGAEIWGLELEFLWQPDLVEGLVLNLAYTYLDAEYTNFTDEVTSAQRLAAAAAAGRNCELRYRETEDGTNPGPIVPFDPANFTADNKYSVSCLVDYTGANLERTPEHAVSGSASYTRPLLDTGLDLLAEVNAQWQDERFLDQENALKFDSYWVADARLGLVHPKYEIIAYLDNVFDDDTIRSGGSGPDFGQQVTETGFTAGLGVSHYFGTLPDPRTFGVRMTYRFGEQ